MSELVTPKSDLVLNIYPRGWDIWRGTGAQLIAEGLIPSHIKWPERLLSRTWIQDGLICKLHRCRPPEKKDPQNLWMKGDYWLLRRSRTSRFIDELTEARSYEKLCELTRKLRKQTPEGISELKRWVAAQDDKRFQAFLALLGTDQPSRPNSSAPAKQAD